MKAIVFVAFSLCVCTASAQGTPAPATPPSQPPVVEPANALAGRALLDALRQGGYVLYMRHALQARVTEECTVSNLAPQGEAMARAVGAAIRERKIPIGKVRASKLCRAIDTARLVDVGPVEITPDLNPGTRVEADKPLHAARDKLLAEPPSPGTNTLLVSHTQSSAEESQRMLIALCEIVVFRPDGHGGAIPVARIRPDEWEAL